MVMICDQDVTAFRQLWLDLSTRSHIAAPLYNSSLIGDALPVAAAPRQVKASLMLQALYPALSLSRLGTFGCSYILQLFVLLFADIASQY